MSLESPLLSSLPLPLWLAPLAALLLLLLLLLLLPPPPLPAIRGAVARDGLPLPPVPPSSPGAPPCVTWGMNRCPPSLLAARSIRGRTLIPETQRQHFTLHVSFLPRK